MENLSSAPNNELLNATEVTTESMPASVAKMLCGRMFGGVPYASDLCFLALVSHLACAITQQATFSSRSLEAFGNGLREIFLMVNCLSFLVVLWQSFGMFIKIDARN